METVEPVLKTFCALHPAFIFTFSLLDQIPRTHGISASTQFCPLAQFSRLNLQKKKVNRNPKHTCLAYFLKFNPELISQRNQTKFSWNRTDATSARRSWSGCFGPHPSAIAVLKQTALRGK